MTIESSITSILSRAGHDIATAIRAEVTAALGLTTAPAATAKRKPKPAPKQAMKAPKAKAPRTASEADVEKVLGIVRDKPGLRSEEIQKTAGKALAPSVKSALGKLRAAGKVRTEGAKRATTYKAA